MRIKAKVEGVNKVKQKLTSKEAEIGDNVRQAIIVSTTLVHATAIKLVQQPPKSGAIYGNHQASAPGEAPATDLGNLVSNISMNVEGSGTQSVGIVISRAAYSSELEYGTKFMEPRPFLRPAFERNAKKIKALIKAAIKGKK